MINLHANSLREAVEYVENHSKARGAAAAYCTNCKKYGHATQHCRMRRKEAPHPSKGNIRSRPNFNSKPTSANETQLQALDEDNASSHSDDCQAIEEEECEEAAHIGEHSDGDSIFHLEVAEAQKRARVDDETRREIIRQFKKYKAKEAIAGNPPPGTYVPVKEAAPLPKAPKLAVTPSFKPKVLPLTATKK